MARLDRSSWRGVVVAIGVIVLSGAGSGFAQSLPSAKTITHVKSRYGHFDKLGPGRWAWAGGDNKRIEELVESASSDDQTLVIERRRGNGSQEIITMTSILRCG